MAVSKKELGFYLEQGERTWVRAGLFDGFPGDVGGVCRVIQGLLIHPGALGLYNLKLPASRIRDRNLKTVEEVLAKVLKLDGSDFVVARAPERRVVAICKHHAMFCVRS